MKLSKLLFFTFSFSITTGQPLMEHPPKWVPGQTVTTQSGPVHGKAASPSNQLSAYLGIPYALPPVGDLRFAPPQPYHGRTPIDGTKFGASCPITSVFGGGALANTTGKNLTTAGFAALEQLSQPFSTFSEDCLTLNVWTKPQVGERKKAVLVWMYGGGYTLGTSADPIYDGQYLAGEEDVVVVSFNYRMNIFGFPGNPNSPANVGLMDQRRAIEWVRDNIAAFGGDPSRITLFGQSAGAGSVDLYSYAHPSDPIISSLVLQSGTTSLGIFTKEETAQGWYNVTSKLGCGGASTDPTSQLACMRSKDTKAITDAIPQTNQSFGSASFWPTIDEKLVFSDYPARDAAGTFIRVPMLIGNTDYEAGYYKAMASVYNAYLPDSVWDAFNLATFECPVAKRANASVQTGVPTWRYRYFGEFPDSRLTTEPDSRAYHGSEILLLFDTLPAPGDNVPAPTQDEVAFGKYMRGAWATFAKDPRKGLTRYEAGWPEYDPAGRTLVRLAYNNTVGTNLEEPALYDSMCG